MANLAAVTMTQWNVRQQILKEVSKMKSKLQPWMSKVTPD